MAFELDLEPLKYASCVLLYRAAPAATAAAAPLIAAMVLESSTMAVVSAIVT